MCNLRQIVLRTRYIPGRLNVIVNMLSRHQQVIQTEWSPLQEVFDHLCSRSHTPQVDLFAKLISPVLDQKASKVGVLNLHWEGLNAYAFSPVSQHALVLGSGQPVSTSSPLTATAGEPADTTLQASVPTGISTTLTLMLGSLSCKHPTTGIPSGSGSKN